MKRLAKLSVLLWWMWFGQYTYVIYPDGTVWPVWQWERVESFKTRSGCYAKLRSMPVSFDYLYQCMDDDTAPL